MNRMIHRMLHLLLFDLARALRPRPATLRHGQIAALRRIPASVRGDLGLGGGLLLTRALERAEAQLADRRHRDADRLLAILSGLAARRGFGALDWDEDGAAHGTTERAPGQRQPGRRGDGAWLRTGVACSATARSSAAFGCGCGWDGKKCRASRAGDVYSGHPGSPGA